MPLEDTGQAEDAKDFKFKLDLWVEFINWLVIYFHYLILIT